MAFDGIVANAVVSELKDCIINGKINKIFEPNKNEVLLGIYNHGKNYALSISIDAVNYRISLTTNTKPNPQNVLNFCMVLRKHLIGGVIKNIYTKGLERVIYTDIDCHNELNDLVTKTLVIELMGKHSNIILLGKNNIVIDSLRHLNKFDNSTRDVFPGNKYVEISSNKLDFEKVQNFEQFYKIFVSFKEEPISKILANTYNGMGQANIAYLLEELGLDETSKNVETLQKIYNSLKQILENIQCYNCNTNKKVSLKEHTKNKKDYYLTLLQSSENLAINFFIDDFYYDKETKEQFKTYRDNVLKLVLNQVKKIKEKITVMDKKLGECENTEKYKLYGELITTNLYQIPDYPQEKVTLQNYYDSSKEITIPLDKTITPSKNAKNFFKKYRKLQNTESIVKKQKELALQELKYLESVVCELEESQTVEDIDSIYSEVCDNLLYGKSANTVNNHVENMWKNTNAKENKARLNKQAKEKNNLEPAVFNIDGYTVLVGKNNKQNDYLTCKLAQNSDIWFHTKDIHGSHVVLKTGNEAAKLDISKSNVSDATLYKCAALAAYYSKARMSQNVAVDYTYIKYVKKPTGAKPGMVVYTDNKTLYVNPKA